MSSIAGSKPALHGMLSLAADMRFNDGVLLIEFAESNRFPRQQVEQPENLKSIRELARQQFGGAVTVTIGSAPDPAPRPEPEPEPAASPPPPANEGTRASAEAIPDSGNGEPPKVDEPLIQKALDLFGGKIVSVEPPEEDAGSEPPA